MAGHFSKPNFGKRTVFSKICLVAGIHHFGIIRAYLDPYWNPLGSTVDPAGILDGSNLDPSWTRDGPTSGTSGIVLDPS